MRLVLVGAGHAHLHLLANAGRLRAGGLDPVLVAPARFDYSGLATGVLSGAIEGEAAGLDVAALAKAAEVEHHPTQVSAADLAARRLFLAEGTPQDFDLASFNIGSVSRDPRDLARQPGVWPVKPLANLFALKSWLEAEMTRRSESPQVVIAGAGQTGFEVAAALAGLAARHGVKPRIHVVGDAAASWAPGRAGKHLRRALEGRGVAFEPGEVIARTSSACQLADGGILPCDALVLATGLEAPPLIGALDLPIGTDGRLRVSPRMQSVADDRVFAAGDCAIIDTAERPAAGVFGVRAAPVLLANLIARATDAPLKAYSPQARWLSIVDLGDGTGLATRGGLWSHGRAALWLKRRLDLGFVARAGRLRPDA